MNKVFHSVRQQKIKYYCRKIRMANRKSYRQEYRDPNLSFQSYSFLFGNSVSQTLIFLSERVIVSQNTHQIKLTKKLCNLQSEVLHSSLQKGKKGIQN